MRKEVKDDGELVVNHEARPFARQLRLPRLEASRAVNTTLHHSTVPQRCLSSCLQMIKRFLMS